MSDYKIVLVAGQEFSVPTTTADNDVRQTLVAQGYADVASADIKRTKRKVGEDEVEVLEFVKKAGTKGLSPADLAALLRRVPPLELPPRAGRPLITPAERRAIARLQAGEYTFASAVDDPFLRSALFVSNDQPGGYTDGPDQEEDLCERVDSLPADADPAPRGW